jgi:hypothetical protein
MLHPHFGCKGRDAIHTDDLYAFNEIVLIVSH